VRKLLLRTCILERVNGELADLLTGSNDATRLLYELEEANAFVVAIDVARTWFRYHHLLADLLRLELRRSEPGEVARLHALAAGWFAEHGHVVESIRHAQLAEDWALATELVGRHGVQLVLDREEDTLGALLAAFPQEMVETDAELATITASGRLRASRWTEADALLSAAQSALAEVPEDRRRRAEVGLATVRLLRARRLGDLDTVVDDTRAVLTSDGDGGAPVAAALKALALMNLGIAEAWTLQLAEAEKDLQAGLAIGREIGSPLLEVGCLGGLGGVFNMSNRLDEGEDTLRQAIVIADRLGWTADPIVAASYMTLAALLVDRGMFEEAEQWVERADPILTHSPEPAATVGLRHVQAQIAFGRGDYNEALERLREGARLTELLRAPHFLGIIDRHWQLRTHLRLGDPDPARAALAEAGAAARDVALWCNLDAHVRLADGDAAGAAAAVAPVLAGEAFAVHVNFEIEAALLDAIARKQMSDSEATERSVERALELAEPQGRVFMVLTVPGAGPLLAVHPTHRTAYGAHLRTLLNHFAGTESISGTEERMEPTEPLTERELAVLRLLPTNLSAQDIGNELFVSVHTVKTHMRKLYAKLDVHTRAEAVQRARALGLLAPSLRR
jgi:LuxR family maltose regulon positive regulatory protein